jgi:TolA-binding protein
MPAITGAITALVFAVGAGAEEGDTPAGTPDGGTPAAPESTPSPDREVPRAPAPAAPGEEPAAPEAEAAEGGVNRYILPDGTELRAPTAEDIEALRILEEEFDRYTERAGGFFSTIDAIVRREHARRRARLLEEYERQIDAEEVLLVEARRRAIEEFVAFLDRYPNDPVYTPDAMFRLAELYYEDSYEQYLDAADQRAEAEERRERGEDVELPPDPVKDFSRTINLFRQLISRYPSYRNLDGALYLLGYCLNEVGEFEEARIAWLHLVCGNSFHYEGPLAPPEDDGGEHPAAALTLREVEDEGPYVDPYSSCAPVVAESRFLDETWLRIGEYHFDYDYSPHGLDLAITSYRNAMRDPESPFYDKALYKLAWSYYRADQYVEAIRHFAQLVEFADERRAATGRTGSEMRPEAIQYLGICFAEDDWNNDQQPDEVSGIDRLQDPRMLPQDRPYTAEVYFRTGDTYFDLARYSDAIRVYELALQRWPLSIEAPHVVEQIAEAHTRNREFELATSARRRLREFGPDTEWAEANRDTNPERVREAGQLARNALYEDAVGHHQLAQQIRQRALDEHNAQLLQRAVEEYGLAAAGYRAYLEQYPNDPDAYEIGYNLAEAMFFSGNYREAADGYAWVRDSNLDDRFREQAAFRMIKSLETIRDEAVRTRTLTLRTEPPEVSGDPPQVTPFDIPEVLRELNEARDTYVRLIPQSGQAPVFAYQVAQTYYHYGHWEEARTRFTRIYEEYCTNHEVAYLSWSNLVNMAGSLDQLDEAERLAQTQLDRNCEPPAVEASEGSPPPSGVNAREQAAIILRSAQFRHAQDRFGQAQQAEEAGQENAVQLFEEAARMYIEAVDASPDHPDAARALNNAAVAFEHADLYESAMAAYRRIVESYSDSEFVDVARFRLALNAYRFFEYEEAVTHFSILARSSKSEDIRRDSIRNTATILTNLEQFEKAAPFWRQFAGPGIAPDNQARSEAAYNVAEMAFKRGSWRDTITEMRAFITEYRSIPEAGPYRVKAAYRISQAYDHLDKTSDYFSALDAVIQEFQASGEKAGSLSAEYAAEARFRLVDRQIDSLEGYKIGGKASAMDQQIADGARRVADLENAYKSVTAYRRPQWTVASHFRIGYAYELLAKAMLDSEPPTDTELIILGELPPEARAELKRLSPAERRELLADQIDQVDQVWRDKMIERVSGMEDRAVAEYEICVKAAREGNIVSDYVRQAYERLFAYRPEQYPLQREGRTDLEMDMVAPPAPATSSDPSPYPQPVSKRPPREGGDE